jgi:hypothetical protein
VAEVLSGCGCEEGAKKADDSTQLPEDTTDVQHMKKALAVFIYLLAVSRA